MGEGHIVDKALLDRPDIAAIAYTESTKKGRRVATDLNERLKKWRSGLELRRNVYFVALT